MGAWEMGPFDNDDAESEWVALWSEGGVLDQALAPLDTIAAVLCDR